MINHNNLRKSQQGFTLVELMVGITIALIVLVAAAGLFVNTLITNTNKIIVQRVDQNIRTLMAYMVEDIRRAGYADVTAVMSGQAFSVATPNCITFSYTKPVSVITAGVVTVTNPEIFFGFKLANNAVYIRKNDISVTCATPVTVAGAWTMLTDPSSAKVTALTFTGSNLLTIHLEIEVVGKFLKNGDPVKRVADTSVKIRNAI